VICGTSAIDANGTATGLSLTVIDSFHASVSNGVSSSAAGFAASAQVDSLYVRAATEPGVVRLGSVNPSLLYDIVLFGSRTSEVATDRYAVYTIGGVEQVLDTKGNTSDVVAFSGVSPNSSGQIDIGVRMLNNSDTGLLSQLSISSTNTDHAYLSAMKATAAGLNYSAAGQVVSENFDSLANTPLNATGQWLNGITVPGWYVTTSAGASLDTYTVHDGSVAKQNALLSVGTIGENDRALGFQTATTTVHTHYGLLLVNNTGMSLDRFTLSYKGEQWRWVNPGLDSLVFEYQVFDAAEGSLTAASGWAAVDELRFDSPKTNATLNQGLDGNLPENSALLTGSAMGFLWKPGQELWLRWTDTGASWQMMGIDDVSFFATVPEPGSALLLLIGGLVGLATRWRRQSR